MTACRSPAAQAPNADETFRRIQDEEAAVAQSSSELSRLSPCEAEAKVTRDLVCEHTARLCELADRLTDVDAAQRCQSARDACLGARERTSVSCATSASNER